MLSTHKCTAACDIRKDGFVASLFLTLPTEAASLLFQYNFMEMGLSPDTRLKKSQLFLWRLQGQLTLFFFIFFKDEADYKDLLDLC